MGVIMIATDVQCKAFKVFDNTSHVLPSALAKVILLQERLAVLGAEDNVVEQLLVSGHGLDFSRWFEFIPLVEGAPVSASGLDVGTASVAGSYDPGNGYAALRAKNSRLKNYRPTKLALVVLVLPRVGERMLPALATSFLASRIPSRIPASSCSLAATSEVRATS